MLKRIRRLELFTQFDYRAVERHLEKMAAKGWLLKKCDRSPFWIYEKSEPVKRCYCITYLRGVTPFTPDGTGDEDVLLEYCEAAGWQLASRWGNACIFFTEDETATPLETDERIRLDTIITSMQKQGYVWSHWLLVVVYALNSYNHINQFRRDPIDFFASNANMMAIQILGWLYLIVALGYWYWWKHKSRTQVADGGSCVEPRYYRHVSSTLVILLILALVTLIPLVIGKAGLFMLVYLILMWGGALLLDRLRRWMQAKGMSAGINKLVFFGGAILLALTVTGILIASVMSGTLIGRLSEDTIPYTVDGFTYQLRQNKLPLYVQDLVDTDYPHYSYIAYEKESVFLSYGEYRQRSYGDRSAQPDLEYDVCNVKFAPLYDMCLREMLEAYRYDESSLNGYVLWPDAPAGAQKAYRYHGTYDYYDWWLLCYEDQILNIRSEWPLTSSQFDTIQQKLIG